MNILEILELDRYDIVRFYTGVIYNDLEVSSTRYSIRYRDRRSFITLLEIMSDGRVNDRGYTFINTIYRDISEYLIYLRNKKLNILLDDN